MRGGRNDEKEDMTQALRYIYEQCLENNRHTLTPEAFNMLFPEGQISVAAFLAECQSQPEGVGLRFEGPLTFYLSN